MKKLTIIVVVICIFIISYIIGLEIGKIEKKDSIKDIENMIENNSPNEEEKAELKELDIDVIENRKNELVFQFSINDFIESYNGYYWANKEKRYLKGLKNWQKLKYDTSIHSMYETYHYNFAEKENVWSLPIISVYVPTNADYIQEIVCEFDDHSFSDTMYELYEEICFYTLKVFFKELSDEKIIDLYKTNIQLAYDNIFPNENGYSSNSVPVALYYKDNIGVYSYFAIGESVRLCIIPIEQETINTFKEKGTKIYEISQSLDK